MSLLLTVLAGLLAIPVAVLTTEILSAVILSRRGLVLPASGDHEQIAVLVPAHNEGRGLLATLADIKAQLRTDDRLVVVADNCTDDTAEVAKSFGAEVTERHNQVKVGKGYALDWGVQYLRSDPPGIVVIVDADCRLMADTIARLSAQCAATQHPTQARYLMTTPDDSPIDYRVAEFAFRVRNWARPIGLRALNLPCQLHGTGMAFPWKIISAADLATGSLVEDMKLTLDLAAAGYPPQYCPSAGIISQFPPSYTGAASQRKRWEQGHIGIIKSVVPRLLYQSLRQRDVRLLALTLDIAVPPLTLVGTITVSIFAMSGAGLLLGLSSTAFVVSTISLLGYLVAVSLCWFRYGRDILPLHSIISVFPFLARKLSLYRQVFSCNPSSQWVRTDRRKIEEDAS